MPTTLTETSTFGASVAVPAAGDARTALSVETPFQELTNRSAWIKGALNGVLLGGDSLYTDTAVSGAGVWVSPISRLVLGSKALSSASALEAPTPGGGLAAETWYYVYGYDSSGVLALETTTSAPDATLTWKTGTTTHRYLGCFRTSTASVALAFRKTGRRYTYRASNDGASELRCLATTSAAGSVTDIIVSRDNTAGRELIPSHARIAVVQSLLTATGGEATARFYTKGDGGTGGITFQQEHEDGAQSHCEFVIETNSARTIQYTLTLGSTGAMSVRCVGFEE